MSMTPSNDSKPRLIMKLIFHQVGVFPSITMAIWSEIQPMLRLF